MQKAVSPLIATLLLIAVALVIAGILYVWSSTYFISQTDTFNTATTSQTECAFAGVNIEDSSTAANACDFNKAAAFYPVAAADANVLSFKLSNTGTVDLTDDFTITLDDGNSVVTATYTGDLSKGTFVIVRCGDNLTGTLCTRSSTTTFATLARGSLQSVRITPTDCPGKYDETQRCENSTG